MPPNTKDFAMNQTMVAYGNRQNPTAFARANNSRFVANLETFNGSAVQQSVLHLDAVCYN